LAPPLESLRGNDADRAAGQIEAGRLRMTDAEPDAASQPMPL
jgi:hypothetical protein